VTIYCHVIVNPSATAGQLSAVGAALWEWCTDGAKHGTIYQYLDNQGLADLIAGRLPAADLAAQAGDGRGVRFGAPDGAFPDHRAAIDSLRRALAAAGVDEVRVDSTRWTEAPTFPAIQKPALPGGADRIVPIAVSLR
jgi:hypothetical protein